MAKTPIRTKHNLGFYSADWPRDPTIKVFRIGTCEGQWYATEFAYHILSVLNNKPGNGHLEDVFQWFEYAAKRDGKLLTVEEVMNARFKKHCIEKRGFIPIPGTDGLLKGFSK